jgi:hypothetical protein
MPEVEYRELVEDIREQGQREMIHYDARNGDILDGRHVGGRARNWARNHGFGPSSAPRRRRSP